MVKFMDDAMGNITGLLKEKTMYNDTIIFFLSDNGGASFAGADHTGNNFPLRRAPRSPSAALPPRPLSARADPTVRRGTKMHNWQGGIRVNGFASGGAIPPPMRGAKLPGLFAVWDWRAPPRIAASLYHATASSRAPPALTRYATLVAGVAGLDATDTEARPEPRAPLLCSNRS